MGKNQSERHQAGNNCHCGTKCLITKLKKCQGFSKGYKEAELRRTNTFTESWRRFPIACWINCARCNKKSPEKSKAQISWRRPADCRGRYQGGKIKLIIPPYLAYGCNDYRGIPGNSVLVFDVELLEVQ
jgi:hypothetical protein